ncbi:MAG: molybdate ABC transporter permease subunit [Deltaproteobacteria bacterium]|nr:molybdate ABC transporter permease subunit [Deltaproteobacteria bacterium]
MDWQPFIISVKLASITALCLLFLATPVAYMLAFSRFRGRAAAEALFALPIVLPPTVLGFLVLVMVGNLSPFGRWYQGVSGKTLAFSFEGILLASVLYSFPFAVQPIQNAFENVNQNLLDAARTLGCTRWQTFWRVILPASQRGFTTGGMLSFAHTVGEFGVVLMVGGSIPGKTKVASIALYESVETLHYGEAAWMAFILLSFSFSILSLVYYLNRKAMAIGW